MSIPYAFLADTSITLAAPGARASMSPRFRKRKHSMTPGLIPALTVTGRTAAPVALSRRSVSPSSMPSVAASSGDNAEHILLHPADRRSLPAPLPVR